VQGSRWASPMSPFAIFNFIWRQNTALGDFLGDNILFIKNYFGLLYNGLSRLMLGQYNVKTLSTMACLSRLMFGQYNVKI
jgi:hypothetical protein